MGIGTPEGPLKTAGEWNSGCCDIMAVALHRMFGLPIMAEFEWGHEDGKKALGYLMHAWVRLPDGRALDAAGPREMFQPFEGGDPDDDWVMGYCIEEIRDDDPHLLDMREEDDYVKSIEISGAYQWIETHLSSVLAQMGISPRGDFARPADAGIGDVLVAGTR